jgi:hypothetical protein
MARRDPLAAAPEVPAFTIVITANFRSAKFNKGPICSMSQTEGLPRHWMARPAMVNGLAGFIMREDDGSIDTMAIEQQDGQIVAIYLTRNPEKLHHVRF